NQMPTNKSEYTGMFKDKNLIFILAEGFNEIAVDKDRTPTLYKLTNSGFVFNNFYSPVFLSTTGGEFQATTGLIPTQEILKLWKSEKPAISYALGNSFGSIGYRAQSYHNWTYTYYKRQETMKTLGFNNYTGCGNGLEKRMDCNWLPLDSEMINVTTSDYLNQEGNFVTYYVSVSGHSPYNSGDNIAKLHYDTVEYLPYSDTVKYYLASQVELDKMLETLIQKLEESGELDDTVIALVGDHYPYTLSTEEMNEAATYTKDGTIEVNRSNFILWNSDMKEKVEVDKVGSQIDVLPTILNLFGIDYDSRLIIGKDILSNYEGLAIFSNRSWVTDYGTYNSSTRKFTIKEGKELSGETEEEYVRRINNRVANNFTISKLIIDNNYYTYILGS
ncbi:MAG: LTA synthase family protein, partial [Bacilli bacterium]|nr:LTA synthase family protein [Bacilli bacterium]